MSILETFHIIFESDAKEATLSTEKLNQTLQKTEQIGNKMGSSIGGTIAKLTGAIAALFSVGMVVGGIKAAAQYSDELGRTSKALNVNVSDLDAWQSAVEKSGGSAQGLQHSISTINDKMASFGRYGKLAIPTLLKLSSQFEKMSKFRSLQIGKQLGLDQGTILFLQQGRRSVEDLIRRQKELGQVTEKDADISRKFKEEWHDTTRVFSGVFNSINSYLLPVFSKILHKVQDFYSYLQKHKPLITGIFIALGAAAAVFLVPPLVSAAVAALILYAPLIAIGAAIALLGVAFALAYDDIVSFNKGFGSLYGDLIKKYPEIHEITKQVGQNFKEIGNIFIWMYQSITSGLDKLFVKFKEFGKWWEKFSGIGDQFKKAFGVDASIGIGKQTLSLIGSSPINGQTSGSILNNQSSSNRNTTVNTGPITIETKADNSLDIARSFSDNLREEMKQSLNNFSDGVLA